MHHWINFQVCVQSIQADKKITFPFFYAVKELEFDADGVATITYNKSETTKWYIKCYPEQVSYIHMYMYTSSA